MRIRGMAGFGRRGYAVYTGVSWQKQPLYQVEYSILSAPTYSTQETALGGTSSLPCAGAAILSRNGAAALSAARSIAR